MSRDADQQLGLELRDEGVESVSSHNVEFIETMRLTALVLSEHSRQVSAVDLRRWAHAHRIEPDHPNAWGAVFRGKWWNERFQPVATRQATTPTRHAGRIIVWRRK